MELFKANKEASEIEFIPWTGELGWEVCSWIPFCRKISEGFDKVIVTSFADSRYLYQDFATEFKTHSQVGRSLKYPKMYRVDGSYRKYGDRRPAGFFDILLHARGIQRKNSINYRQWGKFLEIKQRTLPFTCACIGSMDDQKIEGLFDLRGIDMRLLTEHIAAAKLVIGVSSGVMHLAAHCGTNIITWGDRRTYFGETLEARYKITWNPFNVRVGWIHADDFQPDPELIINQVRELMHYEKDLSQKYSASAG